MVKTSSHNYRYVNNRYKTGAPLLLCSGRDSNLIGGHHNILEYNQTWITQIGVRLVDWFKGYLDRQFTSSLCALNVYTLSKVYLSVTLTKLTLCIIAKNLYFTKTQRREVNKKMKARPEFMPTR